MRTVDILIIGGGAAGIAAAKVCSGAKVLLESMVALKNKHIELVSTLVMPIHHCLFKQHADTPDDHIRYVASHIQALKQTKKWLGEHLSPEIVTIEMEDPAISAKMLGEGLLKDDTAVICSLEAGLQNGLTLMAQNIEDDKRNRTEFRLLKMPDPQYMEKESLSDQLISEKSIVDKLIQVAAILAIVASSILMSMFDMSPWETACTVSGYVVMLIWLILNLHKRLINRTFIGYWKYYTIPLDTKDDIPQMPQAGRQRYTALSCATHRGDQGGGRQAATVWLYLGDEREAYQFYERQGQHPAD